MATPGRRSKPAFTITTAPDRKESWARRRDSLESRGLHKQAGTETASWAHDWDALQAQRARRPKP